MDITDANVVITGGGRGMGRRFAEDLLALGARPYVIDAAADTLATMTGATGIPGEVVDVADEAAVETFFSRYADRVGAPDVLINNAGITADALLAKKKDGRVIGMPTDKWQQVVDINLTGVFFCGRAAAARMISADRPGLIINIGSLSMAGNFGQSNYSATKAGINALTVVWAKELARYRIRSAAIAPGMIRTEMTDKMDPDQIARIAAIIPAGRLGTMTEISQTVQFIITCDYINGRVIAVDGGLRI